MLAKCDTTKDLFDVEFDSGDGNGTEVVQFTRQQVLKHCTSMPGTLQPHTTTPLHAVHYNEARAADKGTEPFTRHLEATLCSNKRRRSRGIIASGQQRNNTQQSCAKTKPVQECPKCSKTAADFPSGAIGLVRHTPQCNPRGPMHASVAVRPVVANVDPTMQLLQLVSLGFEHDAAKEALSVCDENINAAIDRLLQQDFRSEHPSGNPQTEQNLAREPLTDKPQEAANASREWRNKDGSAIAKECSSRDHCPVMDDGVVAAGAVPPGYESMQCDECGSFDLEDNGEQNWHCSACVYDVCMQCRLLAFDHLLDRQQAAAVKATIERLGIAIAQASREAGCPSSDSSSNWLNQRDVEAPEANLAPSTRAAGAKLFQWHKTAQLRLSPATVGAPRAARVKDTSRSGSVILRACHMIIKPHLVATARLINDTTQPATVEIDERADAAMPTPEHTPKPKAAPNRKLTRLLHNLVRRAYSTVQTLWVETTMCT